MAGEILKKRREDLNLTVKEVAEQLKVRRDYLEAIEQDAFEKLPVAVYSRGYIRAYADHLGIDAGPILEVYSKHLSQPEPSTILPVASSKKKGPGLLAAALLLVVLCLVIFGSYYGVTFLRHKEEVPGMDKPAGHVAVPLPVAAVTPAPVPEAAAPVSTPAGTASPSPSPVQAGRGHILRIAAVELTWLSVRVDGKTEEVTLMAGETKKWEFPDKAVLKVGNAGGITVDLDEKTISPLGSRGQVITVVLPSEGD